MKIRLFLKRKLQIKKLDLRKLNCLIKINRIRKNYFLKRKYAFFMNHSFSWIERGCSPQKNINDTYQEPTDRRDSIFLAFRMGPVMKSDRFLVKWKDSNCRFIFLLPGLPNCCRTTTKCRKHGISPNYRLLTIVYCIKTI